MTGSALMLHRYIDARRRNLCDVCDKWAGSPHHYPRLQSTTEIYEPGRRDAIALLWQNLAAQGMAPHPQSAHAKIIEHTANGESWDNEKGWLSPMKPAA